MEPGEYINKIFESGIVNSIKRIVDATKTSLLKKEEVKGLTPESHKALNLFEICFWMLSNVAGEGIQYGQAIEDQLKVGELVCQLVNGNFMLTAQLVKNMMWFLNNIYQFKVLLPPRDLALRLIDATCILM